MSGYVECIGGYPALGNLSAYVTNNYVWTSSGLGQHKLPIVYLMMLFQFEIP